MIAGTGRPLVVIAGPCVLEEESLSVRIGETVRAACEEHGLGYVFKASFDKANRSSVKSARGPGIGAGLDQLASLRERLGVPVTTDLHEPGQAERVAQVADVLQIPAFLCRQTDLLVAAGESAVADGRSCVVNIKKGQFVSPGEMSGPVEKVRDSGCERVILTERGTFFGYNRLVNDFIGIGDLLDGVGAGDPAPPVCFDSTHSVQMPGTASGHGGGLASGGRRERVPLLAAAAVAAGVDLVFIECHPEPERAPSDGTNMLRLEDVPEVVARLARVRSAVLG